jgi:hypothetical protein
MSMRHASASQTATTCTSFDQRNQGMLAWNTCRPVPISATFTRSPGAAPPALPSTRAGKTSGATPAATISFRNVLLVCLIPAPPFLPALLR